MNFWEIIAQDAAAAGGAVNPRRGLVTRLMQTKKLMRRRPGFACVFWLRVNQLLARKKWRGSFRLRIWRHYRFANDISEYATIGPGLLLPHPIDVTVGSAVVIGSNVTLYNGVTLGSKRAGEAYEMPTLGNNVTVYTGAKLFGGVRIGESVEIGALSLCTKDVPAHSVMYGIPPNVTVKPRSRAT